MGTRPGNLTYDLNFVFLIFSFLDALPFYEKLAIGCFSGKLQLLNAP